MSKILYSKPGIDSKIEGLKQRSNELSSRGLQPYLQVIIVGDNPASKLYVRNKERFCKKLDIKFKLISLPDSISEKDFLFEVNKMNNNKLVTGCFVQLPIPKHLSENLDITQIIDPLKDVDGFHYKNTEHIYRNSKFGIRPCTPKGIVTILQENNIEIKGQNIVIIGRSSIVGKPLSLMLTNLDATVTICHSKTKDVRSFTKNANIIISAIGKPNFIDKTFLSKNKDQTIIDVGINNLGNSLVGDCDFKDIKNDVKAITPVPGGVGPMTIFSLMQNILETTNNILLQKDK